MQIGLLPSTQNQTEYGFPKQMDAVYQVFITDAEVAGLTWHMVHRIIEAQPEFARFDTLRSTYKDQIQGGHLFEVSGTVMQTAYSQRNFVYTYDSDLLSEQRGHDLSGNLNTVQYPAFTEGAESTVALADVPIPAFSITATGIRDLSRYASDDTDPSMAFQFIWHNHVNETYWRGVPARQALCNAVACTPVYLSGSQYVYAITFKFSIKTNDIHDPWIYFTDGNGKVPGGEDYGMGGFDDLDASYRHSRQYPTLEFNTQFPLGSGL